MYDNSFKVRIALVLVTLGSCPVILAMQRRAAQVTGRLVPRGAAATGLNTVPSSGYSAQTQGHSSSSFVGMPSLPKDYGSLSYMRRLHEHEDAVADMERMQRNAQLELETKAQQEKYEDKKDRWMWWMLHKLLWVFAVKKLVEWVPAEIHERIIRNSTIPGTLSYKIAKMIEEARWDELRILIWKDLDQYLESFVRMKLSAQIGKINQLSDLKELGISLSTGLYVVVATAVLTEHNEIARIYVDYFIQLWVSRYEEAEIVTEEHNIRAAVKVANPEMLQFYLRHYKSHFAGEMNGLVFVNLGSFFLMEMSREGEIAINVDPKTVLSKNQKECINILLNAGKVAPSEFSPTAKLQVWLSVKDLFDPVEDQWLLIKLKKYFGITSTPLSSSSSVSPILE